MTATERLCGLLDERGVEHEGGERSLRWRDRYGVMMQAFPLANGELGMGVWSCTPEQAVEATLGSCNCSYNCTNSERTNETCLPHFWTHDGALHVELPKLPESISVRLPAQRDREVGSARVWQYTLGAGTCHDLAETPSYRDKTEFKCSECGYEYSAVGGFGCDSGDEPDFNFCPNCGRRVEVDE